MRFIIVFLCFSNWLNAQPNIKEILFESWNYEEAFWENFYLIQYDYDANDSIIFNKEQYWNSEEKKWELYISSRYIFDNGNLISKIDTSSAIFSTNEEDVRIKEWHYKYNTQNQLLLDSLHTIETSDGIEETIKKNVNKFEYDADNLVSEYQFDGIDGETPLRIITHSYDNNSCKNYTKITSRNSAFNLDEEFIYEYYENCQLKSQRNKSYINNGDSLRFGLEKYYSYYQNGLIDTLSSLSYEHATQDWQPYLIEKRIYNGQQKLENEIILNLYFNQVNQNVYDYNEDNLLERKRYFIQLDSLSEFDLFQTDTLEYFADEVNNSRTKILREISPTMNDFTRYDSLFFCDGLLKQTCIERLPSLSRFRGTYIYDIPTDCEDTNSSHHLIIFPNPTSGYLNIKSNLLSSKNNEINIYNANGIFLKTAKVDFRTEEMTLDLSDLSNGIYFIEVKNEGGRLTEKVIIAK